MWYGVASLKASHRSNVIVMSFIIGIQRHKIEDRIGERFDAIDFDQPKHEYLENEGFWDFVFSWYEIVRYYELSRDATIGAHMLTLFEHCRRMLYRAAQDRNVPQRRRSKANDALHQITYYVDRMITQAERNGIRQAHRGDVNDVEGRINWGQGNDPSENAHLN
jgi:hypothetical protein